MVICPVTKYEMTMVSMVPTVLHETDFTKLLMLLSWPVVSTNHFLIGWSKIIGQCLGGETKVYKTYKKSRVTREKKSLAL